MASAQERQTRSYLSPEEIAKARRAINDDLMVDEDQLYAGPRGKIRQMFDEGIVQGADFLVIGSDGFDYTLFPIYRYTGEGDTTAATVTSLRANGDKAMEIYDLHEPREPQINAPKSWNNEQRRENASMATNEQSKNQNNQRASSQAGLNSYVGGQAKTLPSVPAPDQPGSRFNPLAVSRQEQAERRSTQATPARTTARKSLDIGMPPGMIQGVPSEVLNPAGTATQKDAQGEEPGVTEAAAKGFTGGFVAGTQNTGARAQENESASGPASDNSLPGVPQPLIVEAVDAVQGKSPAAAVSRKVVMDPKHVANLEALNGDQNDAFDRAGGNYGH